MPIAITIPRLGWSMDEGTFGGWLKRDGETVRPGDFLFTLESEKGTEEVECLESGILRIPADSPKVGDRVVVGAVIGYVTTSAGEALPEEQAVTVGPSPPEASQGLPKVSDDPIPANRRLRPITPRARRVAAALGIDLNTVDGTGRGGRVRERDIRRSGQRPVPISPVRRTIAARLLESRRETVPVTLTTTVDATNLVTLREQYKIDSDSGPIPSYTDLLVKLAAIALQKHLLLAGQWTEEGIRLPQAIHIGVAVDTERGLYVPVIRDVPALGVRNLAARARELIDRARQGQLSTAEMQGGCFTVSNLGSYGVDSFTPVINYPECAVLGVGRIARRPAVVADTVVPRDQMTLSLTFDHRIVDGAPAARFLQTLSQAIENPPPLPT